MPISICRPVWTGGQFVTDPGGGCTHPDCARPVVLQISICRGVHCTGAGAPQGFPRGEAVTKNGSSEPFLVTDEGCRAVILRFCLCIRPIPHRTARHPSSDPLYPRIRSGGPPSPRGKAWCTANSPANRNLPNYKGNTRVFQWIMVAIMEKIWYIKG